MKKKLTLLSLCLYSSFSFLSATNSDIQSVKDSILLETVTVTGTRTETNLRNLPATVTIVGNKQIENRYEQSLLPIISELVPGLYITSRGIMGYGVSAGAAGGMSIRGVGGSPTTGVLVLIDGHPQYMGLMGHPIADSYQSMMAERVEVVSGPASVLYGSNAMGGVINIITKKQQKDGVRTGAKAMYGSYNTFSGEVNNAVRSGKFSSFVSLDYNRTDGHRNNMDYEQYSGYLNMKYELSKNWSAFGDLNLSQSKSSNPGSILVPMIDNDAEITRGMTSFSLDNKYEKTSGAIKFFYNFGKHRINDGYKDGGSPLESRFRSKDKMLGISVFQTYNYMRGGQVTLGGDFQHMGGDAWTKFVNGNPNAQIAKKSINNVAGYINIQQIIFEKVTLNTGARLDYHSQSGKQWIPQAGISYAPTHATVLKAIVSKGFRNPTIREMYMFPPQNPNLKEERLMNYEISASQALLSNSLNLGVNLYYIKGSNSIAIVKPLEGMPQYINTGKIKNYGVELTARYKLNQNLAFSANYSYLHTKYDIVATPKHKLYADATYTYNKFSLSSGVQYIKDLCTQVEGKGLEKETDSFVLWNMRASYQIVKGVHVFVKGENLLAQKYEINKGFTMPRATVFGGASINF